MTRKRPRQERHKQTTTRPLLCVAAMMWLQHLVGGFFAVGWSTPPLITSTGLRRCSFAQSSYHYHNSCIHSNFLTFSALSSVQSKDNNFPTAESQGETLGVQTHLDKAIRQASCVEQLSLELKIAKKMFASELAGDLPFTRKTTREALRIFTLGLKRLTQLRGCSVTKNKNSDPANGDASAVKVDVSSSSSSLFGQLLADLVRVLGRVNQTSNMDKDQIGDLTDILVSFSTLATQQQSLPSLADVLQPFARLLWQGLASMDVTSRLYPNRWFDLLRASRVLGLEKHGSCHDSLTVRLTSRLTKGDALGRLSNDRLVIALSIFDQTELVGQEGEQFLVVISRRLRKQKVRNGLDDKLLIKAIASTNRLLRQEQGKTKRQRVSETAVTLHDRMVVPSLLQDTTIFEMESLAYTLCHTFLHHLKNSYSVSPRDIAVVIQCASGVIDAEEELVSTLYQCLEASLSPQGETLSTVDIIKVLEATRAWRCNAQPILVRQLGLQFLHKAKLGAVKPWQASAILRCPALLYRKDAEIVQPYSEAVVYLLSNEDFLKESKNASQLSNFLWFFNSVRCFNHHSLMNICRLLLDKRTNHHMSSREACRVLRYLTDIMCWAQPKDAWSIELETTMFDLFHELGETLLSNRLTPLEVSSAIMSYARAAFVQEMGIFDHLVDLMTERAERHSTRQLVEGLWACGKMYSYEQAAQMESEVIPFYLANVKHLANEITIRVDTLNSKDTSQALYALGLLGFEGETVVTCLAQRAKELSSDFTGQEIANIVWALGKVQSKSYDCLFSLIRRVERDAMLELKPQEASNILYGLGRLDLRDEAVFQKLCDIILDQIETASAQSVANVLWASRAVYFKPPKKLLDTWAIKKLGLVPVERKKHP